MLILFRLMLQFVLMVELIEGDVIELININVKIVCGNKVKIGLNCQIEIVEYSGDYICDLSVLVEICMKM